MSEVLRRLVQIRAGGRVERCHGVYHKGSYSNAMHQWGVAMLMYILWPADFARLVLYCLAHDIPEAWVGDIPATTKRYAGIRNQVSNLEDTINIDLGLPRDCELSNLDEQKLKNCDQLELWLWGAEEMQLGNLYAEEVMIELEQFWKEVPLLPEASALWQEAKRCPDKIRPALSGVIRKLAEKQEKAA